MSKRDVQSSGLGAVEANGVHPERLNRSLWGWWIALLLLSMSCAGCDRRTDALKGSGANIEQSQEAREYKQELLATLQKSNRVVVTEHSSEYDLPSQRQGDKLIPREEILYRTLELDRQQKQQFESMVSALDEKPPSLRPSCIFEGHHTIRFYSGSALLSTMNICFRCGEIEWDATQKTEPEELEDGLERFFKQIGFQPKRDWAALAAEHTKRD